MSKSTLDRRKFIATSSKAAAAAFFATIADIRLSNAESVKKIKSFELLKEKYLLSSEITYLNHASIGTMPKKTTELLIQYIKLCETNPWLYMWDDPWKKAIQESREKAADYLHCSAEDLAITHNTTEGFNILANGLDLKPGDEVLFSSLNHVGASECWRVRSRIKGFTVKEFDFPIFEAPGMTAADVVNVYKEQITDKTRILIFPHIDNIIGLRYPVAEMVKMAKSLGVEVIAVDGAQSVSMIPVSMQELGVDLYAANGHKWLQAPKGTGLLYMTPELQAKVHPSQATWGQARWKNTIKIFEDYGTRNLAESITLGDAVDFQLHLETMDKEKYLKSLRSYFIDRVEACPNLVWRSPKKWEMGSSLYAVELKGKKSTDLAEDLYKNSGYVFRLFYNEKQNWNTMRISPNLMTTKEEIDLFIKKLV